MIVCSRHPPLNLKAEEDWASSNAINKIDVRGPEGDHLPTLNRQFHSYFFSGIFSLVLRLKGNEDNDNS